MLVHEAQPDRGGAPIEAMVGECPEDLRSFVFDHRLPIQWHRIRDLQLVTLKMIAVHVVSACSSAVTIDDLQIADEITSKPLNFVEPVVLWASANNPAAPEVCESLCSALCVASKTDGTGSARGSAMPRLTFSRASLTFSRGSALAVSKLSEPVISTNIPPVHLGLRGEVKSTAGPDATHMLLYLTSKTFVGTAGEALAVEVRAARKAELPILMIHEREPSEDACEFGMFFQTTPQDLILGGLFSAIAIAWHADPFRSVCVMQAGMSLQTTTVATTKAAAKHGKWPTSLNYLRHVRAATQLVRNVRVVPPAAAEMTSTSTAQSTERV